jgi:Na+/H+ antiporter NhaD/arsenite permease-like protein
VSPAVAALAALLTAIALSFGTRINVGLPALALAWGLGAQGLGLRPEAVAGQFPSALFLTLLGVTLLFAAAEANGTLKHLAERAVRLARGDRRLLPLLLFVVAGAVSALGPGAISTVALVAPLAMAMGARVGLPPFLCALVVANGANAGNLSPLSAVGIIANSRMAEAGLPPSEGKVFAANFLAHVLVTTIFFLFWLRRSGLPASPLPGEGSPTASPPEGAGTAAFPGPFDRRQRLTLITVAAWAAAAVFLRAPVGLSAFAAVVLLLALRAIDELEAMRRTPWGPILMVSGMSTLVAVVEKAGGLELMSALVARFSTPATITGVMALVTGAISTWSSTSGVVLPAVPALVSRLGGGDPLAIALSINVGSSLVDVSPLSTLGALCIAALGDPAGARDLFRRLMAWGLSMILVGGLLCQLLAGFFARL